MRAFFAIFASLAVFSGSALAHDSRPLFIEIDERGDGVVALRSTAPGAVDPENAPVVRLDYPCLELSRAAADPRRQQARYRCAIGGAEIKIGWPAFNPSISALIRVSYAGGETRTQMLDPAQTTWRAPPSEDFAGVAESYFRIGIEHIIGGVDHLLFLAGLLVIAGTPRRTLFTVTGFTIAHSITLALVALGALRVSVPAVEAIVALSIVFLATEIARGDRTTLAWRRPLLVASAFGLAHGAGFAAALGEVGLPQTETLGALLFFNLGVEAGQIAIIAAVFAALLLIRRAAPAAGALMRLRLIRSAGSYALGVTSGYWFIERAAALIESA
jgi:hydrogenase/urease accessory protein HupE